MLHLILPDGKTHFDQCIERLHITDESNDRHPITDQKWKAGEGAAWLRWREYILNRFAPGADLNDRKIRDVILKNIRQLAEYPYLDFEDGGKLKHLPRS